MKHRLNLKPVQINWLKNKLLPLLAILILYGIMESMGITCPIKYMTGISCAGCGMSRAVFSVIKLNFSDAFYYHPLFWLPPVFILVYLFRNKMKERTFNILVTIIIVLFLIVYLFRFFIPENEIVVFHPQDGLIFRIMQKIYLLKSQA